MKQLLTPILLILLFGGKAFANNDSLLKELNENIRLSADYDASKTREIDNLKNSLPLKGMSPAALFARQLSIYEAYKVFNYDSAYAYAKSLVRIAGDLHEPGHLAAAQLKLRFILLSTGLFKETFYSLSSLSNKAIPDSLKSEYYTLWGRYYFDL